MSFQPFQVPTTIDDLVDTRLEEKNRQKSRGEDLHQMDGVWGCVQRCHDDPHFKRNDSELSMP
jgi:hypothetical protein